MAVDGMPASCTRAVIRPDPDEAISQNQANLTDAFFNDPTGTDMSKIFATKLELTCAADRGLKRLRAPWLLFTHVFVPKPVPTFGDMPGETQLEKVDGPDRVRMIALTYVATHFIGHAHAQSSLGIGTNEAIAALDGLVLRLAELDQRASSRTSTAR